MEKTKHRKGNSPRCSECEFYQERQEGEKLRYPNTGWFTNKKAQGINGRKPLKQLERIQTDGSTCCRLWIDAESGYTQFEVLTGYKEPYDGTKIEVE